MIKLWTRLSRGNRERELSLPDVPPAPDIPPPPDVSLPPPDVRPREELHAINSRAHLVSLRAELLLARAQNRNRTVSGDT